MTSRCPDFAGSNAATADGGAFSFRGRASVRHLRLPWRDAWRGSGRTFRSGADALDKRLAKTGRQDHERVASVQSGEHRRVRCVGNP
jgi:hypothetical protein